METPAASALLKILFVCVGNSCRSPMAESVLKNMVDDKYWYVDSAAIADWNIGRSPEPRCIKVLEQNNLHSNHITRQVYMYIFPLKHRNHFCLNAITYYFFYA